MLCASATYVDFCRRQKAASCTSGIKQLAACKHAGGKVFKQITGSVEPFFFLPTSLYYLGSVVSSTVSSVFLFPELSRWQGTHGLLALQVVLLAKHASVICMWLHSMDPCNVACMLETFPLNLGCMHRTGRKHACSCKQSKGFAAWRHAHHQGCSATCFHQSQWRSG